MRWVILYALVLGAVFGGLVYVSVRQVVEVKVMLEQKLPTLNELLKRDR